MAESYFYAVLVGVALGFVYDLFRLFRFVTYDKFFFDFLFWILTSIVTFCYLLVFNNGSVRAVYILLIFIGFVFYILTLGYVTKPLEIKIAKMMKNQLKKIKQLLKSFKKVLQSLHNIYYNTKVSFKRFFKMKSKGDTDDQADGLKEEVI